MAADVVRCRACPTRWRRARPALAQVGRRRGEARRRAGRDRDRQGQHDLRGRRDEGVLIEIVAQEGDTLPIGEVIARIGRGGRSGPASAGDACGQGSAGRSGATAERGGSRQPRAAEDPAARTARPPRDRDRPTARVKASPVARRMARDLNVELARLEGSGPGRPIVKADVEAAAGGLRPRRPARSADRHRRPRRLAPVTRGAKGEVQVVELNRLQQTVARRMAESKATVPALLSHHRDRHDRGGQGARAS